MRKRRGIQLNSRIARWRGILVGLVLIGLAASSVLLSQFVLLQRGATAQRTDVSAPVSTPAPPSARGPDGGRYLYFVLKQPSGFVLARAREGINNQPVEAPQVIVAFDNAFGQSIADNVVSFQTSPDGRYIAIDGTHSDGELLWMFDTVDQSLKREPPSVSGTFLHWLPNSDGLFLYRPMFPLGPGAPLERANWHPGLWLGNAANGTFTNIDIPQPASFLVDAVASPDGSRIIYSTSSGLGQGSDIWSVTRRGMHVEHLLTLAEDAQRIAGMFSLSPDGRSIAYERLDDSPAPFLPAGLWVMDLNGGHQRLLAQADGGHGFTLRWSPDSSRIAFVARINPGTSTANQNTQMLQSGVNVVDVASGRVWPVAGPTATGLQINVNPVWSADGRQITFTAFNPLNPVIGGTVHYWSVQAGPVNGVRPSVVQVASPVTHVIAPGGW